MFRVGQKVECIDVKGNRSLILGGVYTIVAFLPNEFPISGDGVEVTGPFRALHCLPFFASRFRPIIERKTDISFAHEILRRATSPTAVEGV